MNLSKIFSRRDTDLSVWTVFWISAKTRTTASSDRPGVCQNSRCDARGQIKASGSPGAHVKPDQPVQTGAGLAARYLIRTVLKFPASRSSPWFSARARPKPTARNIRVSVTIRVNTKLTAHTSKLEHGTREER